ncbi:MAG TPA: 3-deoxy-7-phosphoheptulonate synthase [Longimicrobiales bacterium]|nr:3-deoxy-7-phosphoheptulonate synthase [Longimicrobiales bacterium]
MFRQTDDLRIQNLRPLIAPAILMEDLPVTAEASATVAQARERIASGLWGRSDRLVVVVGPCSIHDTEAALEYARLLARKREELCDALDIAMRVYFEKPRTTVGWKGLINDPHLDGTFAINQGLRAARKLLLDVAELGLPAGTEFLDPITPQFYADLVAWGAIGARTTESQVHRELASGLSMPVGFKNGTAGSVSIAVEAALSARHPHHFLSVTKQGVAAIVATMGNEDCHVILRGGRDGPNYSAARVAEVVESLAQRGLARRVMVDCSHANSGKDHLKQVAVAEDLAAQVAGGSEAIFGVMIESFLVDGCQKHTTGSPREQLVRGQSITDACLGWERTERVLERLAEAVLARRRAGV